MAPRRASLYNLARNHRADTGTIWVLFKNASLLFLSVTKMVYSKSLQNKDILLQNGMMMLTIFLLEKVEMLFIYKVVPCKHDLKMSPKYLSKLNNFTTCFFSFNLMNQ